MQTVATAKTKVKMEICLIGAQVMLFGHTALNRNGRASIEALLLLHEHLVSNLANIMPPTSRSVTVSI